MSLEKLKNIIENSSNIVFFGGAGVSTESNIPDFRSNNGLYKAKNNQAYPPEVMLSHSFFVAHPEEFYDFYKNKMIYSEAKPNPAHFALERLESKGKLKAVITQNIDGLHQAAGSKKVLELHGSVHRNYCMNCRKDYDLKYILDNKQSVPRCTACGGIVRPDVVLYEEMLNDDVIGEAISYIENADVLIVGGTSLVVYPAASLITYYRGKELILVNKSATSYDSRASLIFADNIGKVLGSII